MRLLIAPASPSVLWWRVLRRTSNSFQGATDPGAVVVADESTANMVLDTVGLENGTPYFYQDFGWTGSAWIAGAVASATPALSYTDDGIDPLSILEGRLSAGLAAEVAAGLLTPATGAIQVVTSPFALTEGTTFPIVSVHVDSTGPTDRFLGEEVSADFASMDGTWPDTEGWFARTVLRVAAVSVNGDERNAIRRSLRRIIQGNLSVFDAAGLFQIEFSQSDSEDFDGNNMPLYQTVGIFTCNHAATVAGIDPAITDYTVTATVPWELPQNA